MPRVRGPFKVLKQYGPNAFKVQLPEDYNISSTFNIGDLTLHKPVQELGSILSLEGGVETKVSRDKSPTNIRKEQNSVFDKTLAPIALEE